MRFRHGILGLVVIIKGLQPEHILDVRGLTLDLIVNIDVTIYDFQLFAGPGNETFDEVFAGIGGILKDNDIPAPRFDKLIDILED